MSHPGEGHIFNPLFQQFLLDNFDKGYKFRKHGLFRGISEKGLQNAMDSWNEAYGRVHGYIGYSDPKDFLKDYAKATLIHDSWSQDNVIHREDVEKFLDFFTKDERVYDKGISH